MADSDSGPLLLLADGTPWRPVLPSPAVLSPANAPLRAVVRRPAGHLLRPNADRNSLAQGWGLVLPAGERHRADWIAPLVAHREESMGRAAPLFEVEATDLTRADALVSWVRRVLRAAPMETRPLYLLILGDLDEVPLELQQHLSGEAFVGRLAFVDSAGAADPSAYRSYAEKVVRWEREALEQQRLPVWVYGSGDGSHAVSWGQRSVLDPAVEALGARRGSRRAYASVGALPSGGRARDLLDAPALGRPGVLVSLGHGRGGDLPAQARRSRQGALAWTGSRDGDLNATVLRDHLDSRPFLPGGVWLCLACFSAGTPTTSAFAHWLEQSSSAALLGLSSDRPFVAALPQAALAHPDGPLGFIGHVGLALALGFQDIGPGESFRRTRPASVRITALLQQIGTQPASERSAAAGVWGPRWGGPQRIGAAFDTLVRDRVDLERDLADLVDDLVDDRGAAGVDPAVYGSMWLLRQDLAGYILLGDPAAHLPLANTARRAADGALAVDTAVELAWREQADGPLLWRAFEQGGRAALARLGVDADAAVRWLVAEQVRDIRVLNELRPSASEQARWREAFDSGGRDALARLLEEG